MDALIKLLAENAGLSRETACLLIGAAIGFIIAKIVRFRSSRVPPLSAQTLSSGISAAQSSAFTSSVHLSSSSSGSVTLNGKDLQLSQEQVAEIMSLLRAGKKIEAIKLLRSVASLDLKGAKDAIDALD